MRDLQIKTTTLSVIVKDISKEKYNFNHPLQRQSGIWTRQDASNLIDSAIRMFPIYPVLLEEYEDGSYAVIDGKQRLTLFASYANDEFALSKNLKPIIIDDVEYSIAGKKFSKLDDAVKDRFNSREFQLYIMRGVFHDDIREIFARINSSKGLTNTQKRTTVENLELADLINNLKVHPVIEKLTTATQRKKDEDKELIRQVLFLCTVDKEYPLTSFKNNDMNKFLEMYNGNIDWQKIKMIKQAMDVINESFEVFTTKKNCNSLLVYSYYRIVKDNKSVKKWNEWVKNFIESYDTNEEYLQYCKSGSASHEMVSGRFDYFKKAIKEL